MKHNPKILLVIFLFVALAFFGFTKQIAAAPAEGGGSLLTVGGKAKIVYFSNLHQANAHWAKQAIEHIWPLYKTTMGVEPTGLNIYIGDTFVMGKKNSDWVYGLEYSHGDKCYILLSDLNKKETQSTLAHEVFHCWQETLGLGPYTQNEWFWEATAVWAESWVYPANNTEHEYLRVIFPTLNYYFFDSAYSHEYGSYLFFYYLFQKNNFSPTEVIKLIKGLRQQNQVDLFASWPKFNQALKNYAFWNWNRPPFEKYKDEPFFPYIFPSQDSIWLQRIVKDQPVDISPTVFGGGSFYLVLAIDDKIDKLVFDLKKANKLFNSHLSLQALFKVGTKWHYEDWSEFKERKFCRHKSGQRVKELVLIFANGNLKPDREHSQLDLDLEINSKGECPKVWSGVTSISQKQGRGFLKTKSELVLEEELKPIDDGLGGKCWAIKKQRLNYNSQASSQTGCLFPGCTGAITQQTIENGTTKRQPPTDIGLADYICRFRQTKNGLIKFYPTTEIYGKCDYVTRTETSSFNCTCPGPLGNSSEGGTNTTHGLCHAFNGLDLLQPIPVEISNSHEIKGEGGGSSPGSFSKFNVSWDYKYE